SFARGLLGWVGWYFAERAYGTMSDLATAARLRQASPQLPASWYSDARVFDAERKLLFPRAPVYVGHELMVPEPGDYYALPGRSNAQALVRNVESVELLSNVC